MSIIIKTAAFIMFVCLIACNDDDVSFDASGSFEAEEIIISAQALGVIKTFHIEEGETLKAKQHIGYIDSTQLYLTKKQLLANIDALLSKKPHVSTQLGSLQQQLNTAEREKNRIINLVKSDAATTKQLDDTNARIAVVKKQLDALKSSLDILSTSIVKEAEVLQIQIEQLDDRLYKCNIINPVDGTVLSTYAEPNEITAVGKPLYKIADLSTLFLRAYISGDQLSQLKINQAVSVATDDGKGGFKKTKGIVTWISDKAEFTPKTIQTKNERANMVYAIKIKISNDGSYKIGMYGEIKF